MVKGEVRDAPLEGLVTVIVDAAVATGAKPRHTSRARRNERYFMVPGGVSIYSVVGKPVS